MTLEEPKKRRKPVSLVQKTLAECRHRGWNGAVVERWNPHARIRQDLFGIADVLAAADRQLLFIQVCRAKDVAAHVTKIQERSVNLRALLRAGALVEVWSWAIRGARGTRKRYTVRRWRFTSQTELSEVTEPLAKDHHGNEETQAASNGPARDDPD